MTPTKEDVGNLPFFHDAEARQSMPTPFWLFSPTNNKTPIRVQILATR